MEHLMKNSMLHSRRLCTSSSLFGVVLSTSRCRFSSAASSGELATRRLYRVLQHQCADLSKILPAHASGETMLLLQPPLDAQKSGHNRIIPIKSVSSGDDIRTLLLLFREWNEEEDDVDEWYNSIKKVTEPSDPADVFNRFFRDHDPSIWSTISSVRNTIRYAFRNASADSTDSQELHKFRHKMNKYAIRAVKSLTEQADMWRLTSVSYSSDVRVVATSKCIGDSLMGGPMTSTNSPNTKFRFNYRIRVENLSDQETFQLLGRYWHIQEVNAGDGETPIGEPIIVNAPNSGAVGQLPVLRPGEAFEYMSGCELESAQGTMEGSFHLARVPEHTPSAMIGTTIAAFSSPDKFEVPVKPFRLEANTSTSKYHRV